MNWLTTVVLACILSFAFLQYFAYVVDTLNAFTIRGTAQVIKSISPGIPKPYLRILIYSALLLVGTGLTFAFLFPVRFLVRGSLKATFISVVCVAPATFFSLVGLAESGSQFGWVQVAAPVFGLIFFVLTLKHRKTNPHAE